MDFIRLIYRSLNQRFLSKVLFFTFVYNLLLLVPVWYMLEVYDRVVMSRNIHTLVNLVILAVVLLLLMELLNGIRQDIFYKLGRKYVDDNRLLVIESIFSKSFKQNTPLTSNQLDDLNSLQQFYTGPVLLAILDLPFALIFLVLLYMVSTLLGHVVLVVALLVGFITYLNEQAVHPSLKKANEVFNKSQAVLNNTVRNAEVIQAMNMEAAVVQRWTAGHQEYAAYQSQASLSSSRYQSISKHMQVMLGSTMMGLSAFLLLNGLLPIGGGGLIGTSILASRFLAPLVQMIAGWKVLSNAFDAYGRISQLLAEYPKSKPGIELPAPTGQLQLENAYVNIPRAERSLLRQINFQLPAGKTLALIGPSGSGKTTLANLVAGAIPPSVGSVRLDGASIYDWDKNHLGQFVGYLPQDIELYEGTLAENIARFSPEINEARLQQVIELTGLKSFVDQLSEGVNTILGAEGMMLPGGKRQLIGLARAVYKSPKLLILDEPNSNLDQAGELALQATLTALKAAGTTIILITHQKQYLRYADFILVLIAGEMKVFGPSEEVLARISQPAEVAATKNRQVQ